MMGTTGKLRVWLWLAVVPATIGIAHAGVVTDAAQKFLTQQAAQPGDQTQVTVAPGPLARTPCLQPQAFLPNPSQRLVGRVTVGIRCQGSPARYLQASIKVTGNYWVAARQIPAGTVIDASMLTRQRGNLGRLPRQLVRQESAIVGLATTRTLGQGTAISSTSLRQPWLTHSQRPVTVEVQGAGFRITRTATALQNGALGATIRVRATHGTILSGVVAGPDLVRINP